MRLCDYGVDWDITLVDESYLKLRNGLRRMVFLMMLLDGKRFLGVVIILLVLYLGTPLVYSVDLSIAFGIPTGAVDGNVCRVLSRLFLISTDLTKKEGKSLIWSFFS